MCLSLQQIVHHTIGFGLLLPPLTVGRCAVSNLAGQLSLQVRPTRCQQPKWSTPWRRQAFCPPHAAGGGGGQ
eukprot:SAG22_NODE_14805_length_364_cov_1.173585_1_plen_71_part_01